MYPVSANFHTLAIQDAPTTRIRIYFIDDTVDCTDDNDVQTNGTLLVGEAGDTDSNGRIADSGVVFNEYFNPEKNLKIGSCVSSQIEMTLMNFDGALNSFSWGRCKVYLDVYDAANSAWIACPMGVYIIEQPTKVRQKSVACHGYDQMQLLDKPAATWWNAINWSNGLSMHDIVLSMATYLGLTVSTNSATSMTNGTVTYTYRPFEIGGKTYRDVLSVIGEASCTMARFDRDGAIDMRWFNVPMINGSAVTINTDTIGNQCLAIDIAEYFVNWYGFLNYTYGSFSADVGYIVPLIPNGNNAYYIYGNALLNPDNQNITYDDCLDNILVRMAKLGANVATAYKPIQATLIMDWSIEAGDAINIKRNGTTYRLPIFQQKMQWRGGYVVADVTNDGDVVKPYTDSQNEQTKDAISQFIVNGGAGTVNTDLTFAPGESALIVISGAATVRTAAFIVYCGADGTILKRDISSGSAYSYVTSTPYTVTIQNSSHNNNSGLRISF